MGHIIVYNAKNKYRSIHILIAFNPQQEHIIIGCLKDLDFDLFYCMH